MTLIYILNFLIPIAFLVVIGFFLDKSVQPDEAQELRNNLKE